MAKQVVTRTYTASIRNQKRVSDDLDSLGFAVSKLWNVGRWVCDRVWSEIGHIPGHIELTPYLKSHDRYEDLHSQSSQRVLQELAEAFNGWYGKRHNGDTRANPPKYRKYNDERRTPRSTVTFKAAGFKLDTKYERVRPSKGSNLKEYWSDFILCEYQTRPDVDLSTVESSNKSEPSGLVMSGNFTLSVKSKSKCLKHPGRKPWVLTSVSTTSPHSPTKTASVSCTR